MKKITENLAGVCGIYKIVNLINGKTYIGSSKNLRNRLWCHRANLRHNKHHNEHLQNAWNKYGEDNFDYCILETCNEEQQYDREQFYISSLHPEYNIAEEVILPSYSEESRKKHSETKRRMYREGTLVPNGRRVIYMYDLQGNFIRKFDSEREASKILGVYRTQIEKNLSGENKRCRNYIFRYDYHSSIEPYKRAPKDSSYMWKTIHVYNEQEEHFFKNAKECCSYFNVHLVYIRDAIKHHRHFLRKYTIEYTTARQ